MNMKNWVPWNWFKKGMLKPTLDLGATDKNGSAAGQCETDRSKKAHD